ncbi:prepilin-type N-terminal cleavage/methylation domain-containing protein [Corallococcus exiguus]|uniref:type IV pilus modification PilV family protein n=1 Tax=Corallococcus TaxID=83461 RepID=UPI000EBAE155|nr:MULTISPECIES: prepilin-type N-terminal cleavage/methylation domain-containing protein [Corallococcus]NPC68606.1 prepilin-type N-terminal cleavage/methylation domain-containing protein [Corallococcus exiguus]RKI04212.1 prepilin-type N-terminal cleavage/methylation domain-containing protein [Corallococcus sp. AB038B]
MRRIDTRRQAKGVTLLEVMATMAVMLVGIAAAMTVVSQTSNSNRRTLTANQAELIAERTLENIRAQGCTVAPPCGNLVGLDKSREIFYQTAGGELLTVKPAGLIARQYEVALDLDGTPLVGSFENATTGLGVPAVTRNLVDGKPGNVVNVRVSVSWEEPGRSGRQVYVLQTRMAP